jgi:AraC-like DNA-binding protein/quercetin dioxygenase-like cupin family protein
MHQYRFRERLEHGDRTRPWHLYTLTTIQGNVFPCHWHPEWELLIVQRGRMNLTRNQTVESLGPGDAAFLTGTVLHTGTSDDPDLVVNALVFQPELLRSERRDGATDLWVDPLGTGILSVPGVLPAGAVFTDSAKRLVEVIHRDAPGMELAVKGLLFQFLAELVSGGQLRRCLPTVSTDPITQIRGVLQLVEERFAEPLTVEVLAERARLSPSHFSRLFRALTGDTPINHLIRRRVTEAARLLREGQTTVSEAAIRVGFSNFSHFTRTFRAHEGINPSELARRGRTSANAKNG